MRDLANASLWSRKWWSKLITTFLFLSVYSNWTRDASLHPYCSPNIWHPTRGIDGCTFYFSPIFKLFREIFYETTTQLSNVEHGLENQSWPASPISRAKFSKESLRNTYQTLSPVRRTFVFLGSRCTQPLTPRNAHALRCEIFKMADKPKREIKKTKRFCIEYSTYTLVRKANPRKKRYKTVWYWDRYDIKSILRARFQLAKKCI